MSVLNNGRSRDNVMGKYARNIFMWLSTCNIDTKVVHIAGKLKPAADLMFKWFIVLNNVKKCRN